jgi:hypothetical protein
MRELSCQPTGPDARCCMAGITAVDVGKLLK